MKKSFIYIVILGCFPFSISSQESNVEFFDNVRFYLDKIIENGAERAPLSSHAFISFEKQLEQFEFIPAEDNYMLVSIGYCLDSYEEFVYYGKTVFEDVGSHFNVMYLLSYDHITALPPFICDTDAKEDEHATYLDTLMSGCYYTIDADGQGFQAYPDESENYILVFKKEANAGITRTDLSSLVKVYFDGFSKNLIIESGAVQIVEITCLDIQGRELYSTTNISSSISLNSLPSGVCLVVFNTDKGSFTKKIMIP